MCKIGVLGLVLICLSEGLSAALPANAWYFSSTFRETRPDGNRNFDANKGVQYQFGRTLGRFYAVDFGFQDQVFTHTSDSSTTAQSVYNFSLKRFFGLENQQWFIVGEAGQIVSKLQGAKVSSPNVGVGFGIQRTAWKEGPSLSADLRYRIDYDKESNPTIDQYNDFLISFSMTIPLFNKTKSLLAAAEAAGQESVQNVDRSRDGSQMKVAIDSNQPTSQLSTEKSSVPTSTGSTDIEAAEKSAKNKLATANSHVEQTVNSPVVVNKATANSATSKKSQAELKQQDLKTSMANSIDKLRTEINTLEEEEEIITADFSTDSSMIRDISTKNQIERKISAQTFADRNADTDVDGVVDVDDKCAETPLGAPIDASGCALDSDADKVIDLVDLCSGTPAGVSVDERGCGYDDDQDGVPNHRDACADTPEDINVNKTGCERDSDSDGVADSKDHCDDTEPGAKVEMLGCQLTDVIVLKADTFQDESTILNNSAKEILEKISETLQRYPEKRVELTGNANDPRISEYSKRISIGRANSAKLYLLELGADAEVMDYGSFKSATVVSSSTEKIDRPEDRLVNMRFVDVEK